MKNIILKSSGIIVVVAVFSLQGSCPPLPDASSVEITDIPSSIRDDYQLRIGFEGEEWITGDPVAETVIFYGPFSSTETFAALSKIIEDYNNVVTVTIWSKPTSSHSFGYIGEATSNDGTNKSFSGDWLIQFDIDWDEFINP